MSASRTTDPEDHPGIEFFFVDVFASRPLTGNPLTLVPEADHLDLDQMRAVAREFNQSETTFLLRPTGDGADVRLRSFTPAGTEVGGAGHNALGAWLWLAKTGRVGTGVHVQRIGEQLLTVEIVGGEHELIRVVMNQSPPQFGAVIDAGGQLASALGIDSSDLDTTLPAQVVSTGVAHLLVPLRDRAVVDRVSADPRALLAILGAAGGEGCYVYATEGSGDGADAYARFFNPTVGISEDPATGTAAGPLAGALVRAGRVADGDTVQVEQGQAIGRPSRLQIQVSGDLVRLSGSGLIVGHGRLNI